MSERRWKKTIFDELLEMLSNVDPEPCVFLRGVEDRYYRMLDVDARVVSYAHHISYRLHHGRPPLLGKQVDGEFWTVGHRCDRKGCINPHHLENITMSQNLKDAYDRGLIDIEQHSKNVSRGLKNMTPEKKIQWKIRISQSLNRLYRRRKRDARAA